MFQIKGCSSEEHHSQRFQLGTHDGIGLSRAFTAEFIWERSGPNRASNSEDLSHMQLDKTQSSKITACVTVGQHASVIALRGGRCWWLPRSKTSGVMTYDWHIWHLGRACCVVSQESKVAGQCSGLQPPFARARLQLPRRAKRQGHSDT